MRRTEGVRGFSIDKEALEITPEGEKDNSQLMTYGAELHNMPSKRGEVYAAQWNRFIAGVWKWSSRERIADIVGITELGEAMKRKRIRWAASTYERGIEELRGMAEVILKSCLSQETIFRWPKGVRERTAELEGVTEGGVYTDGSRIEGQTAAATITRATFLGRYATVMDVEMLAIAMGWEIGNTVITDSQGAIG